MEQQKTIWQIDTAHSQVQFKVKHLMIATVSGKFTDFEGTVETDNEDFSNASVRFSAKVASVHTGNEQRDQHLQGTDFFDAEQFPTMEFVSSGFTGSGEERELKGELTLHGHTGPVTMKVQFEGMAKDPWGNTKAGFTVEGKINRKDWGLTWNAALEAGGVVVSEEVRLLFEIELLKQN